ncbi:hypothetical protein [Haliangium sp.]|uniref:hypothetical protein n=1 Tax=Haliangium sp. TaxID=2663208 RepID=UPI003D110EE7
MEVFSHRAASLVATFALLAAVSAAHAQEQTPAPAQPSAAAPAPAAAQPPASAQPPAPASTPASTPAPQPEANCTDRVDDDGDTVVDCADADCFDDPACQPDGGPEIGDARCSDWVDNDRDGHTDCDDDSCLGPDTGVCRGSWQPPSGAGAGAQASSGAAAVAEEDMPELGPGMTVEDLIGTGGDIDGERNDLLCSDGIDNDGDGRTDCADFGCRFDRTVTVCQGSPDFRFSVVARAQVNYFPDVEEDDEGDTPLDARFSVIQLRAFGPMPYIEDSFFLLSMRAERTPRLTFLMFQVPVGSRGHYLNVNSGTGGLSGELIRSASKRLLLDPPFYVYNAFEQGNGGAVEIGGPIDSGGRAAFRAFLAGGTGFFSGNVGGGFFRDNRVNFTVTAGAQVAFNLIGYYSRWDTPFLYTPVPLTLGVSVGVKYDQRAEERFPAINAHAALRYRRLVVLAETYAKREIEFGSDQFAYNIQAGYLVIPRYLLVAADFGEYLSTELDEAIPGDSAYERPRQETQWRVAAHGYLWRNVLIASLLYSDRRLDPEPDQTEDEVIREIRLTAQYRF